MEEETKTKYSGTSPKDISEESYQALVDENNQLKWERLLSNEKMYQAEVLNNQMRLINGINALGGLISEMNDKLDGLKPKPAVVEETPKKKKLI